MSKCVPVKLTADVVVDGSGPVILIGPNGSGKTRLGVKMVSLNQADMVPALRDIALPPDITLRSLTAATQELRNVVQRQRTNPWLMSNEINWLFGKLMIADSGSAVRFRDRISAGENPDIETTKLMRLRLSWTHLFPARHISFAGREPTVVYGYPSVTSGYPPQQMSDGERVALYLAGHVLDTESSILIVDEPEVHFHSSSLLSSGQRWSRCGQMYALFISPTIFLSPCRGATHDFVLVMPNKDPQIVEISDQLPTELPEVLLAAVSFSIYAIRIVFCEGEDDKSLDWDLYSAWFKG